MKKRYLSLLIIAVIGTWLLSFFILKDDPNRGTFGDMFGAANALFSGLAFAGLIYTIILQSKELGLQRQELTETRKEIKGQKKELANQNKHLERQNFEGTFFQMLKLHNQLLGSIDFISGGGSKHVKMKYGRDVFHVIWNKHKKYFFEDAPNGTTIEDLEKRKEQIESAYHKLWSNYEKEIGHYFRSLYNIFKYIDFAKPENHEVYTNIVRAQLSGQELLILFYNCIYNGENFGGFIEDYKLLKHLPQHEIPAMVDYHFFSEKAFGGSYPYKSFKPRRGKDCEVPPHTISLS